ncbi:MAG: YihY family inner membrane protein [Mesosutterella sp.]|nr:YihY family inner membrane protein [Mesosutterella sp.]
MKQLKKPEYKRSRAETAALLRRAAGLAAARFRETNIVEVASSMTLATLLSIVPLLAVALAMFSVVPAFAPYRASLEEFLSGVIPGQYSVQIFHYLRSFSQHASGLSVFGVAGLAVSAYFLIDKLFVTLNRIFRVRHRRTVIQNAILYWAILTLGPLVAVASISVTTYLAKMALSGLSSGAAAWGLTFFTVALQGLFYTALYTLVPNCYVEWRHALAAGLFTALAGLVVKRCFSIYISSGTLTNLYGAFVALPVFILWIYVTWILVFGGAALAATLPMVRSGRFADAFRPGNDLATGIALLSVLLSRKDAGYPVVPLVQLAREAGSWPEAAETVLEKLASSGYVAEVKGAGRPRSGAWVLIADPDRTTLRAAFDSMAIDPRIRFFHPQGGKAPAWYSGLASSPALSTPLRKLLEPGAGVGRPEKAPPSAAPQR